MAKSVKPARSAKPSKPAAKAPAKTAKASAKPAPKPVAKKPAPPAKKPAPKPVSKPAAKAPAAKPPAKAPPPKPPAKVEAPKAPPPAPAPAAKTEIPARKGITIVNKSGPPKKPKIKQPSVDIASIAGNLLGSGSIRKPLISSGPKAPATRPLGAHGEGYEADPKVIGKTPFNKAQLDHFRQMLQRKRGELLGDIHHMEEEALRSPSGSLSNTPQHIAEQGSETYEQSLQLDLAAVDRKLLKEIDDAIARIDAGTYGICEFSGKPIKTERLEELPWARFTIEAQRELERRSMRV